MLCTVCEQECYAGPLEHSIRVRMPGNALSLETFSPYQVLLPCVSPISPFSKDWLGCRVRVNVSVRVRVRVRV